MNQIITKEEDTIVEAQDIPELHMVIFQGDVILGSGNTKTSSLDGFQIDAKIDAVKSDPPLPKLVSSPSLLADINPGAKINFELIFFIFLSKLFFVLFQSTIFLLS